MQLSALNPRLPKPARGFTLVELLVVIAIIALLVSLMLPALNKSKMATHTAVCASNLRQMALGYSMYREDNRQYYNPLYASYTDTSGTYTRAFPFRLQPYLGGLGRSTTGVINSGLNTTTLRGRRHLFYCPAATYYTFADYTPGPLRTDAWLYGPSWDMAIATYSQLSSLGYNDSDASSWLRLKRELVFPPQTLLIIDGANEPRVDHSFWPGYQRLRHNDQTTANLLMGDYHVDNANKAKMDTNWASRIFHLYDPNQYRYAKW